MSHKYHTWFCCTKLDSKISFANKIAVSCAVLHKFAPLNQDDWNDNGNDDPQDQGHESNNDDVMRDGDDIQNVWKDYIANAWLNSRMFNHANVIGESKKLAHTTTVSMDAV